MTTSVFEIFCVVCIQVCMCMYVHVCKARGQLGYASSEASHFIFWECLTRIYVNVQLNYDFYALGLFSKWYYPGFLNDYF